MQFVQRRHGARRARSKAPARRQAGGILLDGVPLADPFFGYIPYSAVAPALLERIRVTRGGGSGPFGAGALAGTIEMESGDPTSLGLLSGQALVNQRGETALSRVDDGVTLVVSGSADDDELAAVAAAVQP